MVFTFHGAHVTGKTSRRHVTAHPRADDIIAAQQPMTTLRYAVKTLSFQQLVKERVGDKDMAHTT